MKIQYEAWAIKWDYTSKSGRTMYIEGPIRTMLYHTKKLARLYIKKNHGYIAHRPDLRREPHCWRMPKAVKVQVTINELGEKI